MKIKGCRYRFEVPENPFILHSCRVVKTHHACKKAPRHYCPFGNDQLSDLCVDYALGGDTI
jgi:hypothetical protein